MFYLLKGYPLEFVQPNRLILSSGAVAWEVFLPLRTFERLKSQNLSQEITLFVAVMLVREEFIQVFGFESKEEREFFLKLNKLSRVGPVLALNILSYYTPEDIKRIVLERRTQDLAKVPGIGQKKAEKLILEIKGLFERLTKKGKTLPEPVVDLLSEAKECLISLGFSARVAEEVLLKVYTEGDSLEEILKKSLKELAPFQCPAER